MRKNTQPPAGNTAAPFITKEKYEMLGKVMDFMRAVRDPCEAAVGMSLICDGETGAFISNIAASVVLQRRSGDPYRVASMRETHDIFNAWGKPAMAHAH